MIVKRFCDNCTRVYSDKLAQCPSCGLPNIRDVYNDPDNISNPFEKRPMRSGTIRFGKPISYEKPAFELFKNGFLALILLAIIIYGLFYFFNTTNILWLSLIMTIYLLAAYWVHPEPDHDSMDSSYIIEGLFTKADNNNAKLLYVAGFLLAGRYITLSIMELFLWHKEKN